MTQFFGGIRQKNDHTFVVFNDTIFWGIQRKNDCTCVLYNLPNFSGNLAKYAQHFIFPAVTFSRISAKGYALFATNCVRWCACSVCEQWRKWNGVLFKVVLPAHKDPCSCTCPFCDSDCSSWMCVSSIHDGAYLMSTILTICSLVCLWDCIYNRSQFSLFQYIGTFTLHLPHIFVLSCH